MKKKALEILSKEIGIGENQISKTILLLKEGGTIPFISRYRKEMTGGLDEVAIGKIKLGYEKQLEIEKRKLAITKAIKEQGKWSDELEQIIRETFDSNLLEDIYLPYKQKRKTRAETARNNGLEPLAKMIMAQRDANISNKIPQFLNKNVLTQDNAIQGAKDIIAEWVSENKLSRDVVRSSFQRTAIISSKLVKKKESEAGKFKDYFQFQEPLNKCKSHRLLALRRGEEEGFLNVTIAPSDSEEVLKRLKRIFIKNDLFGHVESAIEDSYKRLISPSIESEFSAISKEKADEEAIRVFAENLRQLLLTAPLGEKRILSIDPGFRSGCKLVCIDEKGDLLHNENIYPHPPQSQIKQSINKINSLIDAYKIEAIAIGNGTAGRETENLIRKMKFKNDVEVYIVNEAGASVYSASLIAREEFPQYDVTVRGAVSIGRRLMDPLAELVKIDPKSIGVGQYQHDVNQKMLQSQLDIVVQSCVNKVGVDVNTASKHLLTYVAGLGPQLAENIVNYRKENGSFSSRTQFKKVPRMGDVAFQQCAGFLRIKAPKNPLDNSAVHPETYGTVKRIVEDLECKIEELIGNKEAISRIDIDNYITDEIGVETLEDIKSELLKPGLDPRKKAKMFEFAKGVNKITDLQPNMVLPGIVTNITNFGAFVDVGVKQDGLVHISNLANEYISSPADYVCLNQHVQVKVIELDVDRKRIGLSMKDV